MENSQQQSLSVSRSAIFMQQVYSWMCIGLLFTAAIAYVVASSQTLLSMILNPIVTIGMFLGMLGLAFYLPSRMHTLSATQASGFFLLFAGLNGAVLSPILLMYTTSSVFMTFIVTASMFGALAFYGLVTKRDLSAMGAFMFMGMIGLIVASIINMFFASSAMQFVINVAGVIIFAGLTAYDNQRIKQMGESAPLDDSLAIRRGAILGALSLYLDFINLFLFLLRFMGASRD